VCQVQTGERRLHDHGYLHTYTDNVFGASKTDSEIEERKQEMGEVWEIKDIRETKYFLGTRVQQDLNLGTIRITQ
jgi:hypothetical protein